jgi:hypothetical protein
MITQEQLIALMALRMCSDPWPTGNEMDMTIIDEFLNNESIKHGFTDWIEAYHKL